MLSSNPYYSQERVFTSSSSFFVVVVAAAVGRTRLRAGEGSEGDGDGAGAASACADSLDLEPPLALCPQPLDLKRLVVPGVDCSGKRKGASV